MAPPSAQPAAASSVLRDLLHPLRAQFGSHRILLAVAAVPGVLLIAASSGDAPAPTELRWFLVSLPAIVVAVTTASTVLRANSRPDTRSALMGTAFLAMAVVLVARAVAMYPGALWSPGIARIADVLVLPLGALVLALSVAPKLRQHKNQELVSQSAPALAVFLIGVFVLMFQRADAIPVVPEAGSTGALICFVVGAALLFVLARRAARTAALTARLSDFTVTVGTTSAIFAYWGITNAFEGDMLWWSAHALELGGLAAMCIPAARDLRHQTASRPLVGDLRAANLVADEEAFLDGRVHHLLRQLARKDDVTEGHTRRVATLAVQIGEHLGLDAASLRDMAAGGLLHDIGKLRTPDAILKKPAALTDDEYEVIKRHPSDGRALLEPIGLFNERVLHLVDSHHERIDGGGYPHGLTGAQLSLETRILTVADVFDALTSQRPYRVAWPADRALEVIERDSGKAFDPRCVAALREIVAPARMLTRPRRRTTV